MDKCFLSQFYPSKFKCFLLERLFWTLKFGVLHCRVFNYSIYLCILIISILFLPVKALYAKNEVEVNKTGISSYELLDCQSLKNLSVFAIQPQYSIDSLSLRKKIDELVAAELKKIGTVIEVKVPDVTGFGKSEARISMIFKDIPVFKEEQHPIAEMSFLISSSTIIEKTQLKCSSYIWFLQSYIDGGIEEKNAHNILSVVNSSLEKFVSEYKNANLGQKKKPVFYLYSP